MSYIIADLVPAIVEIGTELVRWFGGLIGG